MAGSRLPARLVRAVVKNQNLSTSQRLSSSEKDICKLSHVLLSRERRLLLCRRTGGTAHFTQQAGNHQLAAHAACPNMAATNVPCAAVHGSHYSTTGGGDGLAPHAVHLKVVDPYKLVAEDMHSLAGDIRKALGTDAALLRNMSHYYFDGKGKSFRPLVTLLMARACNVHSGLDESVTWRQNVVAMVAEMIHTASLIHDDVIDASDTRRGHSSLNKMQGQRRPILTGDYILAQTSILLARTNNTRVISTLSGILEDLVSGEFMQLGSKENEDERFAHYLKKTYKKTASLIANTCKSVAILGECHEDIIDVAFQFGRNLGIAFQLIDDLLDFTSCDSMMGKPTAADLKLGLATAPVLFAAQEYPDLNALIMRRFSEDGDVEYARHCVAESRGVEQTRLLARTHSSEAVSCLHRLHPSQPQRALLHLAALLLDRKK